MIMLALDGHADARRAYYPEDPVSFIQCRPLHLTFCDFLVVYYGGDTVFVRIPGRHVQTHE